MSNYNDRIRLAQAMGWRRGEVHTVAVMGHPIHAQRWIDPEGADRAPSALPDPFTNANDDYAVLAWFRSGANIGICTYPDWSWSPNDYAIGDYARGALDVLDRVESSHEL